MSIIHQIYVHDYVVNEYFHLWHQEQGLEEMLYFCVVGHTSDELTFHWVADSQAVTLDDAISLPQLHVQGWFLEESLGTYRVGE